MVSRTPEVVTEPPGKMVRAESSLSQVDVEILNKQKAAPPLVKYHSQANISFTNVPSQDTSGWKKLFRQKSGVLGVMHNLTKRNRLVSKHGRINAYTRDDGQQNHRFLKDFFTSTIDLSWSVIFMGFAASFFLSWLVFAVVWYLVAFVHGDLVEDKPKEHVVCVDNIKDFTSCFLFSLETQHTIGYGGRATTEQCSMAIIVMSLQSILGVVIQACMAGIVFAKFTKPSHRGETIMFSKNALISLRNGSLYLMVRLTDLRPSHLIECHVSGHFLAKKTTKEGEVVPYHLETMKFGSSMEDEDSDYLQLFFPLVVAHKIDASSPLFELSPKDLQAKQFEIILSLEGTTPETGNTIQVRTSYLPSEILWGQRFQHTTVAYDKDASKFGITYSTIDAMEDDNTPRMSAKILEEMGDEENS